MHNFYSVGGATFGVRSTSGAFGRWVSRTLAAYRTDERAGEGYYSIVLAGDTDEKGRLGKQFHVLYRSGLVVIKTMHLATLGRMLLGEIEAILYQFRDDALYLDASVIRSNGTSVLVPSSAMVFVSALGGQIRRAGLSLPADTSVAIDPDTGRVVPIRSTLDVPRDALDRLAAVSPPEVATDRRWSEEPTKIDLICSVNLEEESPRRISRARAMYQLGSDTMNLPQMGRLGVGALAKLVQDAECYSLPYLQPGQTLNGLRSVLAGRGA